MTVFIEYVLLDNFIIDYLVLKATFELTGLEYRRWRLAVCAFFGAVFALIYPMLYVHVVLLTAIKILFGLSLIMTANSYKDLKSLYVNVLVFFAYTFLIGGAVIGVYNLLGIPLGSESSVALAVIPVYLLLSGLNKLVRHFYKRKDVVPFIRDLEISAFGMQLKAKGFLDSGNGLYDGDNPIIVCSNIFAERFLSVDKLAKIKYKRIEINTVNGKSFNLAFKIDCLKIYNGQSSNIYNNVTMCVSSYPVGEGYDVILHPAFFGGENEQAFEQTEKIS